MHIVRDWEQRELSSDVRRHVYDFIRSMSLDPNSSASVSTPLDPNTVYSKDNCPIVITPEIKDRDLHAHGNQTRPRPLVGRYVHNQCGRALNQEALRAQSLPEASRCLPLYCSIPNQTQRPAYCARLT